MREWYYIQAAEGSLIKNLSFLFTLQIILFPLTSIYATPIPNLSIADFLLVLTFPFFLFVSSQSNFKIHKVSISVYIFFFYILVTMIIQFVEETGVGILSTIRFLLYLLVLTYSYKLFDFSFAMRFIHKLTAFISLIVIIQFLSYFFFSYIIPWKLPLLSVIDKDMLDITDFESFFKYYRPSGLFMEPTHFAQFSLISITYTLNGNIISERKIGKVILPIIGILCSASSLGFFFLIIAFGYWGGRKFSLKIDFKRILIFIFFLTIVIYLISSIDYFKYIIIRMFGEDGVGYGAAMGYRFDSISYFMSGKLDFKDWLIGRGRSSEDIYFTGFFYFLNANGIIGLLLYILLSLQFIITASSFGKYLMIIVFILSIGSEVVANFGLLFYGSFIFGSINKDRDYKTMLT